MKLHEMKQVLRAAEAKPAPSGPLEGELEDDNEEFESVEETLDFAIQLIESTARLLDFISNMKPGTRLTPGLILQVDEQAGALFDFVAEAETAEYDDDEDETKKDTPPLTRQELKALEDIEWEGAE